MEAISHCFPLPVAHEIITAHWRMLLSHVSFNLSNTKTFLMQPLNREALKSTARP